MNTGMNGADHEGATLGGRYQLLQQIGSSADSQSPQRLVSWRGYDNILRRPVRLDVHWPGGAAARRFLDCGLTAATVSHPALARVFDAVDSGDHAYVVSAWIHGTSLSAMLADGPLDPDQAAGMIGQIADGVAVAHTAGTPVGVLGPDHLVTTPSDTVALMRVPLPGPTPADDIRGLGALLYAALTAHWPLDGGGGALPVAPTSGAGLPTPRQLVPSVPEDLSGLTMRALYVGRPGSVQSAADLRDALHNRQHDMVPFTTTTLEETPRRRSRLATFGVPAAGVAALSLVGVLVANLVGAMPRPSDHDHHAAAPPATSSSSSASSSSPTRSATPPTTPVRPVSVTSFNPYNQPPGDDNAEDVPRTTDGNPTTTWQTETYFRSPNFGNLKPGVGLLYDFGKPVEIGAVKISTPIPGSTVQIRAGDDGQATLGGFSTMSGSAKLTGSQTIKINGTHSARYWLVWMTSLAPTDGGQFQGTIGEVDFLH